MNNCKLPYQSMGLNEQRPVKMYDVDKKLLIGEFESIAECARFINVSTRQVCYCLKNKGIMKESTNSLGLKLAFR